MFVCVSNLPHPPARVLEYPLEHGNPSTFPLPDLCGIPCREMGSREETKLTHGLLGGDFTGAHRDEALTHLPKGYFK